jgi:hypothetical protein
MNGKRTNEILKEQLSLSAEREKSLLEQIRRQTEQIRQLSGQVERISLLLEEQAKTIASLEEALLQKNKTVSSLSGKNRGLTKLLSNGSEKVSVEKHPAPEDQKQTLSPRERGNNNAKRKEFFDLQEVIEEVWPSHAAFDKSRAKIIGSTDSIRYTYLPPRFIKKIYRQYNCLVEGKVYSGSAPRAPFMNSNYDASFLAGLIRLRYIYSMPVERIIRMFNENGFELNKSTAHGLIQKACALLDGFEGTLRKAIHSDPYIRLDETWYNVLNEGENEKGKAIRKVYIWSAMANNLNLVHFFYQDGSRKKEVFGNYLDNSYRGAVHTDGLACYKKIETDAYPNAIRIGCIQHAKRKFIDVGDDEHAREVVGIINQLYRIEHEINPEWPTGKKLKYRNLKAAPVLKQLKRKLLGWKDDPPEMPTSPLTGAVNYLLEEWNAIENYLLDVSYSLDNNPIERANRYISLSRRNSLFFGSHAGAKRGALLYSLACSCRLHGINVFDYFTDLLNRMPYLPPVPDYETLRALLPDKWTKSTREE